MISGPGIKTVKPNSFAPLYSHSKYLKQTILFQEKKVAYQIQYPQRTVSLEKILNLINFLHFSNRKMSVHLYGVHNDTDYLVEARPDPASSEEITFRFPSNHFELQGYILRHILIPKETHLVAVPASLKWLGPERATVVIAGNGILLEQRRAQRFASREIWAEIKKAQTVVRGELLDFNSFSLKVKLAADLHSFLSELSNSGDLSLRMGRGESVYFSGKCEIVQAYYHNGKWDVVFRLEDVAEEAPGRRLKVRNTRLHIDPAPIASFTHPFSQIGVEREIVDISNKGISVRERMKECTLMPGLFIPELRIQHAGCIDIACQARVVHKREEGEYLIFGLSITDLDLQNYTRLASLTFNHINPTVFISKKINLEALWEFFFDSGFIYPKKYCLIGTAQDDFKDTYRRLYETSPEIARHFTSERDGRIYGHISMVKAYSRTWLLHHLAARPMDGRIVGFDLLKQVMYFLDGLHEFSSMKSDFILAFYQPKNKFADHAYGGFATAMRDRKQVSQDLVAHLTVPVSRITGLPKDYILGECSHEDLDRFERFYEEVSGGLLLDAMCIKGGCMIDRELEEGYWNRGILRSCRMFSLKCAGELKAIFVWEQSDPGLNLSEMLNSIKIFILDLSVDWKILHNSVSYLLRREEKSEAVLFVYPEVYVHDLPIKSKPYQLWTLDMKKCEYDFKEYMMKKFRIKF